MLGATRSAASCCIPLTAAIVASQLAAPQGASAAGSPEAKALAYLMREVPAWRERHACGSCHNNGDGARALFRARKLGFAVPDQALANTTRWLLSPPDWERSGDQPEASDKKLAGIQFGAALLAAVDAGSIADRRALIETAAKLASDQDEDGAWRIAEQSSLGSPVAYGPFVATWLTQRTLALADGARFGREVARAEEFFLGNPPRNVMDAAATTLALAGRKSSAARARTQQALELLLSAQTADGGFGPYPRTAPEVFDTALALLALHNAGGSAHEEPIRKGRQYLAREQAESGGWRETTRPPGYQSYAQRISTTAWATLALLETAGR
jgi:hypothetical protein